MFILNWPVISWKITAFENINYRLIRNTGNCYGNNQLIDLTSYIILVSFIILSRDVEQNPGPIAESNVTKQKVILCYKNVLYKTTVLWELNLI